MRTSPRALIGAAVLCTVGSTGAIAQTTIGAPGGSGEIVTCGNTLGIVNRCGQLFTVPVGDHILQSFSLTLSSASNTAFEIYAMGPGPTRGSSALFTQAIAATTGLETLTFTPVGGLTLTSGAQYAAMIAIDTDETVSLEHDDTNSYAGGSFVFCSGGNLLCLDDLVGADDVAFQATFVGPLVTVPEPSTWLLTGAGLLALGGLARRRQRASGSPTVRRG